MQNLVTFNNDLKEVTTTTLKVAEVFGKKHDNVMKAVNKLLGNIRGIDDFNQVKNDLVKNNEMSKQFKFGIATYLDNGRQYNHYILNKEAFYLLVMGFTGKKALQFKMEFIRAFNEMEKALKAKNSLPVAQVDMKAIGGMVKKCCAVAVREELTKALSDDFETQNWLEIMSRGLKMRTDNLVKQRHADLISENEELKLRLNNIKLLAN